MPRFKNDVTGRRPSGSHGQFLCINRLASNRKQRIEQLLGGHPPPGRAGKPDFVFGGSEPVMRTGLPLVSMRVKDQPSHMFEVVVVGNQFVGQVIEQFRMGWLPRRTSRPRAARSRGPCTDATADLQSLGRIAHSAERSQSRLAIRVNHSDPAPSWPTEYLRPNRCQWPECGRIKSPGANEMSISGCRPPGSTTTVLDFGISTA